MGKNGLAVRNDTKNLLTSRNIIKEGFSHAIIVVARNAYPSELVLN